MTPINDDTIIGVDIAFRDDNWVRDIRQTPNLQPLLRLITLIPSRRRFLALLYDSNMLKSVIIVTLFHNKNMSQ